MNWFETLTGFREESAEQVRANIYLTGNKLCSQYNGTEYTCGKLEIPTLSELRIRVDISTFNAKIRATERIGNIMHIHKEPDNAHATFQVASQFNLLEMVSPNVSPEKGVSIYENDHTQGPTCAIACGAGTIYRNYFVPLNGQIGQNASNQIDCLSEIAKYFNNDVLQLWNMTNGYVLVNNAQSMQIINSTISQLTPADYHELKGLLRVGVQWNTEVTASPEKHLVTQVYCSALPVAYSNLAPELWQPFAQLILDATYEATFLVAVQNALQNGNFTLFLTLVGGGVFGNRKTWIAAAIKKNMQKFARVPLQVRLVSYGQSNPEIQNLLASFKN